MWSSDLNVKDTNLLSCYNGLSWMISKIGSIFSEICTFVWQIEGSTAKKGRHITQVECDEHTQLGSDKKYRNAGRVPAKLRHLFASEDPLPNILVFLSWKMWSSDLSVKDTNLLSCYNGLSWMISKIGSIFSEICTFVWQIKGSTTKKRQRM
jgi:hypothetical protein